MLPFLEIITFPNVLESLVLEQAVGKIYNVLFGNTERRGIALLGFLINVFSNREQPTTETLNHFELLLVVYWQIIKLNSLAFTHEPFEPVAMRFAEIFKDFIRKTLWTFSKSPGPTWNVYFTILTLPVRYHQLTGHADPSKETNHLKCHLRLGTTPRWTP